MDIAILLGSFLLLMALGLPVAVCLGLSAVLTLWFLEIPIVVAYQTMGAGLNSFALIAIPFFIFAGELMNQAGIAERLVRFAETLLGRVRGGLGQVNVVANLFFGGVTGSAVAGASAMGSAMIPRMVARGYDADYAVNVTASAATTALLVPPSHNMILYAIAAGGGISVSALFMAGIVPALLLTLSLMLVSWLVAVKRGYPAGRFPGWRIVAISFVGAIPALLAALVIFGGILSGVFTATESSAVAVVYTLIVAGFVYRTLNRRCFLDACTRAVRTTAMVMLIIGTAAAFGWVMAVTEIPTKLSDAILLVSDHPIIILLLINLILVVLGTFMDMAPLIVITTPIFLPVATDIGMDPVQFGIMLILNQGLGLLTPPVGSVQVVSCAVGGISIEESMRTIWPFYAAFAAVLIVVTYVPAASLWLPGLLAS